MVPTRNEDDDMEVNIIECTQVSNNAQVESICEEDTVESTSSFGDSFSGNMEVESQLLFDDCTSDFRWRRKSLMTDHWKRFIRPLKWRCKWLELQIKNLQTQSLKYDRELASNEDRKTFEFHTYVARGFDAKTIPFYSSEQRRKKAIKRKKRKRIEEMTDIMPYMLQHNVFSYYGSVKDDCSNIDKGIYATDECPSNESKDDDNVREQFLGKIEVLQSQVRKLKSQIEKVKYKMGMAMSFMGKGLPSTQMVGFVMGTLYKQFMEKDINNFDDFHIAILDIFNTFNSALPGKHYDAPSRKELEACFSTWQNAAEKAAERKEIFINFMKKHVHLSKLDDSAMVTGFVTPPAAMAAKKAAENVPQLKLVKYVPDVVFVPTATVLALVSVKLTRRMFLGGLASS
ncbi:hypothetical protein M5689_012841 [Euphorbia peplus]|nr:hypothetical protein M5689_012841 [Euphorbia peplus]